MSTHTAHRSRPDERRRLCRYDLLLVLLPLPLFLGVLWATLASAPMSTGVGFGSLPSLALLAYGLFIGSPTTVAERA